MSKGKQNGITLIALVITIIVLLILASVSIAMLTGDNGILTQAKKTKEETEEASEIEEWQMAYNNLLIEYNKGDKTIFKKENVLGNLNKQLKEPKVEIATIYYNDKLVKAEDIQKIEPIYKYVTKSKNMYFTISEQGKINYLKTLHQLVQQYDSNGINIQAGKWISYPAEYPNKSKDYPISDELNGWRILSNDGDYVKIVTAGIPTRYEYNHNKAIVDEWNDFEKFESQKFDWGEIKDISVLKNEELAIGLRSINYDDIKEVTTDMNYIPTYSNVAWGSELWPNRLRGLIGSDNEYIVATWQHKESDSLYYMTFPYDQYGMHLNSNGYLNFPGVRVVAYLKKDITIYETEYFNGSSKNKPLLLVY